MLPKFGTGLGSNGLSRGRTQVWGQRCVQFLAPRCPFGQKGADGKDLELALEMLLLKEVAPLGSVHLERGRVRREKKARTASLNSG
jgi:hypothetical protein